MPADPDRPSLQANPFSPPVAGVTTELEPDRGRLADLDLPTLRALLKFEQGINRGASTLCAIGGMQPFIQRMMHGSDAPHGFAVAMFDFGVVMTSLAIAAMIFLRWGIVGWVITVATFGTQRVYARLFGRDRITADALNHEIQCRAAEECGRQAPAWQPAPPKGMAKSQVVWMYVALIVVAGAAGIVLGIHHHQQDNEAVVRQIDSKCPIMVDAHTRLDQVTSAAGDGLVYHYTIIDADDADVLAQKDAIIQAGTDRIRQSPLGAQLHGHPLTFVFSNAKGDGLFSYTVTP